MFTREEIAELMKEHSMESAANIAAAVGILRDLTEDERMGVFHYFCTFCGDDDPRCQCWNDE